ncbi:MAG: nucleotidyltransferase family protein [Victivallaceae bacterium]|nr:nucleotidyltransferase family protein [Victivallaceae bacterium]
MIFNSMDRLGETCGDDAFDRGAADTMVRVLRDWCSGNPARGVGDDELLELCRPWYLEPCAFYFNRVEVASARYHISSCRMTRIRGELDAVAEVAASVGVRFMPIKGAAVAWRAYPSPALRQMSDVDILVDPGMDGVLSDALVAHGWRHMGGNGGREHIPGLNRTGISVEIHTRLPGIDERGSSYAWNHAGRVSEFLYELPLELIPLVSFSHMRRHQYCGAPRTLLDCGFAMRSCAFDYGSYVELASEIGAPDPSLLFAAFPDFFPGVPDGMRERFGASVVDAFVRQSMSTRHVDVESWELAKLSKDGGMRKWLVDRFRGMSPASIRSQTGNYNGHYLRLMWGYVAVFSRKFLRLFQTPRSESARLLERCALIDRAIEKNAGR